MKIEARDFKVIKECSLEPNGLTVVCGHNSHGKSTLLEMITSVISNNTSDSQFRHGETSFYSKIQVDSDHQIEYERTSSGVQVIVNGDREHPITKAGRGPLYQTVPDFPLKRLDFEDVRLFPNISYQNDSSIFSQVSVYDLFSMMFSSVAKISSRMTLHKKALSKVSSDLNAAEILYEDAKIKKDEVQNRLKSFNQKYPDFLEQYKQSKDVLDTYKRYQESLEQFKEFPSFPNEGRKQVIMENEPKLRSLLNKYHRIRKLQRSQEEWKISLSDKRDTEALLEKVRRHKPLLERGVFLLEAALTYCSQKQELQSLQELYSSLPSKIEQTQRVSSLLSAAQEVLGQRTLLNQSLKQRDSVQESLRTIKAKLDSYDYCPYCGSSLEGLDGTKPVTE